MRNAKWIWVGAGIGLIGGWGIAALILHHVSWWALAISLGLGVLYCSLLTWLFNRRQRERREMLRLVEPLRRFIADHEEETNGGHLH